MKKMIIIILSLFIAFSPLLALGNFSYADDGADYPTIGGGSGGGWTNVDMSDPKSVVSAFKAYVASRNLKFVHVPNEVSNIVQFDYLMIKNAADSLNIDLTTLNAYIWYGYEFVTGGDAPLLKYFFHPSGLEMLNDIYAKIIQDNSISPNTSKSIYSGKFFKDDDGNSCYCFVKNTRLMTDTEQMNNTQYLNQVTGVGTMLLTTGNKIFVDTINNQQLLFPFKVHGNTYTFYTKTFKDNNVNGNVINCVTVKYNSAVSDIGQSPTDCLYLTDDYYNTSESFFTAIYFPNMGNSTYLGFFCKGKSYGTTPYYVLKKSVEIEEPDLTNASVNAERGEENTPESNKSLTVITNSETVNNYITNNTTNNTYNYNNDPNPPTNKPPKLPDTPDFPTGVTNPNGDPFNFQMPNIGIDWNLNLNGENLPFPFSIPFDIIRFLTILDTEPQAPKYEIHTEILNNPVNLDIDLSVFDDGMAIIRNIILVGYVIFLIISTRALFHIY